MKNTGLAPYFVTVSLFFFANSVKAPFSWG